MDKANEYIFDIVSERTPYNSRLVLPPNAYKQLYPYLETAIMNGNQMTDEYNRIVLELNLDEETIQFLTTIAQKNINQSIIFSIPIIFN